MLHVKLHLEKCPECDLLKDVSILGVTSLLGPRKVQCSRCGYIITTRRSEWEDKTAFGRGYMLIVFFLYLLVGGFIGGLMFYATYELWVMHVSVDMLSLHDEKSLECIWLAVGCTVFMLLTKMVGSHNRKCADRELCKDGIVSFDFTFNGHIKAIFLFTLPYFAAQIKSLLS